MSKYVFVIYHRDYEAFLELLRSCGVVHIQEHTSPQTIEKFVARQAEQKEVSIALKRLCSYKEEGTKVLSEVPSSLRGKEALEQFEALLHQLAEVTQEVTSLRERIAEVEVWGDFDPQRIEALEGAGYRLEYYKGSTSVATEEYLSVHGLIEVSRQGSSVYLVRLVRVDEAGETLSIGEPCLAPTASLSFLRRELEGLEDRTQELQGQLSFLATTEEESVRLYEQELQDEMDWINAQSQSCSQAGGALQVLEGWVPTCDKDKLVNRLEQTYYYEEQEVTPEDIVPIKLKNNFFVRLFEPITEMFSLPNYSELDQTALFAPFFLLFFALCFGDGGYGLLLLIGATYFRWKGKGESSSVLALLQWLGGAAFVVGMMMGSFCGIELGYAKVEDYFMSQSNLMTLSIVLGLLQIFFGKGVAAYKIKIQHGWKHAIAPFATVLMLVTLCIVLLLPKISWSVSEGVQYALWGVVGLSLAVTLLYNTPGKNPFLNLGTGLWNSYNLASGLLGDTLSYIRLFAIGLTGGILGGVFNQLAVEQTAGLPAILRYPLMLLVLLLGHGLNFGLAMIGSFVHPLRLTLVEFYKNSEFEGGGKAYHPFKQSKTSK